MQPQPASELAALLSSSRRPWDSPKGACQVHTSPVRALMLDRGVKRSACGHIASDSSGRQRKQIGSRRGKRKEAGMQGRAPPGWVADRLIGVSLLL